MPQEETKKQNPILGVITFLVGIGIGYGVVQLFFVPKPIPPATLESFYVSFHSEPFGAAISIDGQAIGQAPIDIEFVPEKKNQTYKLEFSSPGFEKKEMPFTATKKEDVTITLSPIQ